MSRRFTACLWLTAVLGALPPAAQAAAPVLHVMAASSLTGPLTELAQRFSRSTGIQVETEFGPSGVLMERIEHGAAADVFASANMEYPQRLEQEGKAASAVIFTRNRLCLIARPDLQLQTATVLPHLLDPELRIGTSTPGDDPGGDYAWQLFDKVGQHAPGADIALKRRAQKLVGGRSSPAIPAGHDPMKYYILERRAVDVFVGYCSQRKPGHDTQVDRVELPPQLAVAADYGLSVLSRPQAGDSAGFRFALFLLSPAAQEVLAGYGYTPVAAEFANGAKRNYPAALTTRPAAGQPVTARSSTGQPATAAAAH